MAETKFNKEQLRAILTYALKDIGCSDIACKDCSLRMLDVGAGHHCSITLMPSYRGVVKQACELYVHKHRDKFNLSDVVEILL